MRHYLKPKGAPATIKRVSSKSPLKKSISPAWITRSPSLSQFNFDALSISDEASHSTTRFSELPYSFPNKRNVVLPPIQYSQKQHTSLG